MWDVFLHAANALDTSVHVYLQCRTHASIISVGNQFLVTRRYKKKPHVPFNTAGNILMTGESAGTTREDGSCLAAHIGATGASRNTAKHFRPERKDGCFGGTHITSNTDWLITYWANLRGSSNRITVVFRAADTRCCSRASSDEIHLCPPRTSGRHFPPPYPHSQRQVPGWRRARMRIAVRIPHPLSVVPSIKTILRLRSATGLAYSYITHLKKNNTLQ